LQSHKDLNNKRQNFIPFFDRLDKETSYLCASRFQGQQTVLKRLF